MERDVDVVVFEFDVQTVIDSNLHRDGLYGHQFLEIHDTEIMIPLDIRSKQFARSTHQCTDKVSESARE